MKTILITIGVILALLGVLATVQYVRHHKATVTIEKTSLLPREDIKAEGPAQFTPITRVESDRLALMEDVSLLGLTAGAFNPEFAPLSDLERDTLNNNSQQNLELQSMTAGNLNDNAGLGTATWGAVLVVVLLIIMIF
jgi:hypothetical protein